MSNTTYTRLFFFLTIMLLLLIGCTGRKPFFYDFEEEYTLDSLSWRCKTIFALSDKYVTSGQRCLKMELYPYPYSGIILNNFNPDWSKNKILKFDIYNQEKISLHLTTCIYDVNNSLHIIRMNNKNNPIFSNGYNYSIILNPGMNHISLQLNSFSTSETTRKIDLTKIQAMALFFSNLKEERVIYLDYVRLR